MSELTFIQELVLTIFIVIIVIISFCCGLYVGMSIGIIRERKKHLLLLPQDEVVIIHRVQFQYNLMTGYTICGAKYINNSNVNFTRHWKNVTCEKCLSKKDG